MKNLSQDEIEALARIKEDVEITIDTKFSSFPQSVKTNLKSLVPIFVALYFKSLNHDPNNINWKNKDHVFPINNFSNIIKNIVKVHAGYTNFEDLENFLKKYTFDKIENTFGEAIGHYISAREMGDNHERYYYIVLSDSDLLNNISSLEFILKNKMKRIIIIAYTKSDNKEINKESRLNGRLISLGLDTLVINASIPSYVCDAIIYAKKLDKPSVILANVN